MAKTLTINSDCVLLVEGEADRGFFEQVCKSLQLNPQIQVATPKDCNGYNSKEGVFERLPLLLKNIEDGKLKQLAIVVDADYKEANGLGYQATIKRISAIVAKYDFFLAKNQNNGLIFNHTDGFADIGLWIMPNNNDDGMLEDFIKSCIHNQEQALFNHASDTVINLTDKKFKDHHYSKAEIATWLAWQKVPSHGLYIAIKDKLLDNDNRLFQQLSDWLKYVYSNSP